MEMDWEITDLHKNFCAWTAKRIQWTTHKKKRCTAERKSPRNPFFLFVPPQTTNSLSTLERNLTFFFLHASLDTRLLLASVFRNSRSKVSVLPEISHCACRFLYRCMHLPFVGVSRAYLFVLQRKSTFDSLSFRNGSAKTGRPCNNVDAKDRRESGGIWLTCCCCMTFSKQPAFVLTARAFEADFINFEFRVGIFFFVLLTGNSEVGHSCLISLKIIIGNFSSRNCFPVTEVTHEALKTKDFLRKNENWFWRNNEIHPSGIACGFVDWDGCLVNDVSFAAGERLTEDAAWEFKESFQISSGVNETKSVICGHSISWDAATSFKPHANQPHKLKRWIFKSPFTTHVS
jgi:hypothetical protein